MDISKIASGNVAGARNRRIIRLWHSWKKLINYYLQKVVCLTVAAWLNRTESQFMVQHRPDSHVHFGHFSDYRCLSKAWSAQRQYHNSCDMVRFYSLYLNVMQVLSEGVPGDFVELGVYKGNSAFIFATLARQQGRRLYLLDTFSGFDGRDLRGFDSSKPFQFADTSLEEVRDFIGTEGVVYVPGVFPESAAHVSLPSRVAVVHIDCDLYEPMKAGLEWFYPRLSPGGILLLHDYSSGYWPGAKRAIDEFLTPRGEKVVLLPDKSGTAVVRKCAKCSG